MAICGEKSVNCEYSKKFVLFKSTVKITWLKLLKRWIRVLSCNLQMEHKGEGVFPKRNSILLRYNVEYFVLKGPKICASTYLPGQKVYSFPV